MRGHCVSMLFFLLPLIVFQIFLFQPLSGNLRIIFFNAKNTFFMYQRIFYFFFDYFPNKINLLYFLFLLYVH